MSFNINERNTGYFTSNTLELPRFQRKSTWTDKDNFKLCISVFKGYPIGVIIVNQSNGTKYLLDGRQRRHALLTMYSDPFAVYNWAKAFLSFKSTTSEADVRTQFNKQIDEYLQRPFEANAEGLSEQELEEQAFDGVEESAEQTYNASTQEENLKALLDLICLVHEKYRRKSALESIYCFDGIIPIEKLEYSYVVDGEYKINHADLKEYIHERCEKNHTTRDKFLNHLEKRYSLDASEKNKINQYFDVHWDYFEKSFRIIQKTDNIIFNEAKIGLIELVNATVLDAQNIFSLINAGGVKLTSEELISARPFWNRQINNPSNEVSAESRKLYSFLGVNDPGNVVRWDACASLLSRIDRGHVIFDDYDKILEDSTIKFDSKKTIFTKKLTLGFKLYSGIVAGGISAEDIKKIENNTLPNLSTPINWEIDIDNFVRDFNLVMDLLYANDYFHYLCSWNKTVISIAGNSVALEFAILVFKKWEKLGRPTRVNQQQVKELQHKAIILLDKLVYEYCMRLWKGSADSKFKNDLQNIDSRFVPVPDSDWRTLIDMYANDDAYKSASALLYHFYCLRKMSPRTFSHKTKYDVDHILPQSWFLSSETIDKKKMNSLGNLALLPKDENIAKSDRTLAELRSDLNGVWLYQRVLEYSDIDESDVDKYSDITNYQSLFDKRVKIFKEVFTSSRTSVFNI